MKRPNSTAQGLGLMHSMSIGHYIARHPAIRHLRAAPCNGEDNHYVYGELLGMLSQEIIALADEGVI
jgi:hypothetical protein